ncbi:ankyrin repeat domain-containing protein, partial [archaeon]
MCVCVRVLRAAAVLACGCVHGFPPLCPTEPDCTLHRWVRRRAGARVRAHRAMCAHTYLRLECTLLLETVVRARARQAQNVLPARECARGYTQHCCCCCCLPRITLALRANACTRAQHQDTVSLPALCAPAMLSFRTWLAATASLAVVVAMAASPAPAPSTSSTAAAATVYAWPTEHALAHAAEAGDVATLRAVLAQRVSTDTAGAGSPSSHSAATAAHWLAVANDTLLHRAVAAGLSRAVSALLEVGASVDARDAVSGDTPLHVAAAVDSDSLVHTLLAHNAACNVFNAQGMTPVHVAAAAGRMRALNALLSHARAALDT